MEIEIKSAIDQALEGRTPTGRRQRITAKLREDMIDALEFRCINGWTTAKIARRLDVTDRTVRTYLGLAATYDDERVRRCLAARARAAG